MAAMSSPLPDLPGTSAGPMPPTASGMIGTSSPNPDQQSQVQEVLKLEVGRIHGLISQLETLARSHPEAASHFQRASSALGQAIMAITQTLTRGNEGPRPPVLG